MKKSIALILLAIAMAIPSFALTPAGSYDDELYGRQRSSSTVKLQIEVNAGYITGGKLNTSAFGKIDTNLARPYVEVVGGVRLGEYVFAGIGTGVQYAYGSCNLISAASQITQEGAPESWGAVNIPIYANARGYIPTRIIVKPYISVSLGGSVVATSNFSQDGYGKLNGGLFMKFGAGMNISKFNIGLGMAAQDLKWINAQGVTQFNAGNNAFYIEAGVTF